MIILIKDIQNRHSQTGTERAEKEGVVCKARKGQSV